MNQNEVNYIIQLKLRKFHGMQITDRRKIMENATKRYSQK